MSRVSTKPDAPGTCSAIVIAASFRARFVGLLSSRVCAHGEILVLTSCHSIHTFGMREPIDVAFVDASAQVVAAYRALPPCRLRSNQQAVAVLERRASDSAAWFEPGQRLTLSLLCADNKSVCYKEHE